MNVSNKRDKKNYSDTKVSMSIPQGHQLEEKDFNKVDFDSKLTLEETPKKMKTRSSLYDELNRNEKKILEEDYYEFPSHILRGMALGIDLVFSYLLVNFAILMVPLTKSVFQLFLNKYQLVFWYGENVLNTSILVGHLFLFLLAFIVVPVAFFNTSLGKKIFKIRVRGDMKYSLSLVQIFKRELIYKPISIFLVVGFIFPFFDKKKRSLHDKFAGTLVVVD